MIPVKSVFVRFYEGKVEIWGAAAPNKWLSSWNKLRENGFFYYRHFIA